MKGKDMIPFGKFKGVPLDRIPLSYLCYAIENFSFMAWQLKRELIEEVQERMERYKQSINIFAPTCYLEQCLERFYARKEEMDQRSGEAKQSGV